MKKNITTLLVVGAFFLYSCSSGNSDKEIIGAYVSRDTVAQRHIYSGDTIGHSVIADTVFVSPKEKGYQVSRHRWYLNDYDQKGWDRRYDGVMKTHAVTFDKTDSTLNSELYAPIYLDLNKNELFLGESKSRVYRKVK